MGITILKKEITIKKLIVFLFGMAFVALGMTLFVKSRTGAEPWALLYAGVSTATGLELGTVVQIIGIAMVAFVCLWERKLPELGTVMSFIVIGFFANLFETIDFSFIGTGLFANILALAAAITIMAVGLGVYVAADIGEGNIELLQFFIAEKLGKSITTVRVVMDCSVALIGYLLGGPLGIGTIISAFTIGPLLAFFLKLAKKYIFREKYSGANL